MLMGILAILKCFLGVQSYNTEQVLWLRDEEKLFESYHPGFAEIIMQGHTEKRQKKEIGKEESNQ